jgi:hypothetical protein
MKINIAIDLKSLALGAATAAVLIFAAGAASPAGTVGRFQVSVGSDGKAAIVDTVTGQCWTAAINASGQAVGTIGTNTFLTPKST